MRQFILAGNVAYSSQTTPDKLAEGSVGFFYNKDGEFTVDSDGTGIKNVATLILGRPSEKGGNVVIPIYKNNFSYVKGKYQAATKFKATVIIASPTKVGEYTLLIIKKGVGFNVRNKWAATVYVNDTSMVASALAKKFEEAINSNSESSGVVSSAADTTLTITANKDGVDYSVVGADMLFGQEVTTNTSGLPAYGDAKYITDLANKAAADAGFEYTYRDDVSYLYPNYPLDPLKQPAAEDTGFTIFTLRFSEPRAVGTRDDVVNQIVQVAFPTGATGLATFETVLKAIAGETTPGMEMASLKESPSINTESVGTSTINVK